MTKARNSGVGSFRLPTSMLVRLVWDLSAAKVSDAITATLESFARTVMHSGHVHALWMRYPATYPIQFLVIASMANGGTHSDPAIASFSDGFDTTGLRRGTI